MAAKKLDLRVTHNSQHSYSLNSVLGSISEYKTCIKSALCNTPLLFKVKYFSNLNRNAICAIFLVADCYSWVHRHIEQDVRCYFTISKREYKYFYFAGMVS